MPAKPFLPLVLSVKREDWRMFDANSASHDAQFRLHRTTALERDDHSCRFCGFRTPKWQEVHHLNDDHSDNRLENLVTACIYCHMVQHIGLAGANGEALLAFIPEIAQADLHHLVRATQVAKAAAARPMGRPGSEDSSARTLAELAEVATAIETRLHSRSNDCERLLGTSDPSELATVLMRVAAERPDVYDKRAEILHGVRLLPLGRRRVDGVEKMGEIVSSWMSSGGAYVGLTPKTWLHLYKNLQGEIR